MKTNARNNETRMALVRAFFSLLAEKPIDKVTVTDITLRCGVNRNTFYYHYRDVYDLYEGIVGLFARQLESVFSSERFDAKDAIGSIAKLAHAKRTVVYHMEEYRLIPELTAFPVPEFYANGTAKAFAWCIHRLR